MSCARLFNMCRSSRFKFSTDDVDDEYTEKGRLLIRKELESTARGLQVGEVLHSAYFDLEFPNIAGTGPARGRKAKGIFGGMFAKKTPLAAHEAPAPVVASAAPKPMSAAAAAAARFVLVPSLPLILLSDPYTSAGGCREVLVGRVAQPWDLLILGRQQITPTPPSYQPGMSKVWLCLALAPLLRLLLLAVTKGSRALIASSPTLEREWEDQSQPLVIRASFNVMG